VVEMTTRAGRIRWRHFLAVFVSGLLGAAALMVGMAQGALAVSFAVSGTPLKISADLLRGYGFVAFGTVDHEINGRLHPVVANGFRRTVLTGFCQSILTPRVPFIGDVTLRTTAPVTSAVNLVTDVAFISGDTTYQNVEINRDASTLTAGPPGVRGLPGTTGTQAQAVIVAHLRQISWATVAGTLTLNGMVTTVQRGRHECF
jgi:hypothetical protein